MKNFIDRLSKNFAVNLAWLMAAILLAAGSPWTASAQTGTKRTVTGTVTDATFNEPVVGAGVSQS